MAREDGALAAALEAARGVVSAYLFGSAARGRTHRESDIDVGVLFDRDVHPSAEARFEERLALHGRLSAALRREDIDIVILNDAPPLFARAIVTEGRRVFCADADRDRSFRRDAMLRAADIEPFLRRARQAALDALMRQPSSR